MLRYTFVRQDDQSDCGTAALATVALHYGFRFPVQKLRTIAGTDRAGTNLMGLVTAAETIGFVTRPVKGSLSALSKISCPAIAHVINDDGSGHFVVIHKVTKSKVVIADPGQGIVKLKAEKFREIWTGYLLLLEPDATRELRKNDQTPSPFHRLIHLLWQARAVLLEAFVCAVLMTLLGITTSFFVQHLVDSVLVRNEVALLNAFGIGMTLVLIFKVFFGIIRQYLLAYAGRKIDLTLISAYARHIFALPMSFFEMRQVGEILSRVNDAGKIREAISGTALTVMVDAVMVLVSVTVLWCYDLQLAAMATAFIPVLMLTVLAHQPATKRLARQAMEEDAKFDAHLVEGVTGVETIKAYSLERMRCEEGEQKLAKVVKSIFSLQLLGISLTSAGMIVNTVAGIATLWYGGHRVIDGALSVGQLLFFYTMLGYMLTPLERLAAANLSIQDALVAMDRLYQVMDLDAEDASDSSKAGFPSLRHSIELRDVTFRYGCRDDVLKNVSLKIPAGAKVAIVGQSGSGKSTLLKLLTRYYDPVNGQVLIDATDMRDFELSSLRRGIGLVSQEPSVYSGTVKENIALGNPDANMSEIISATKAAGLDRFVAGLPDRYDTLIGERGTNLSGGQRQRLAIARALVRKPQVLIFDEATSHLDTATEKAIQRSMQNEFANRTVVMVAHRLSTIRDADLIYLMDQGSVAESGTHDELIRQNGLYADLWRAQTDGSQSLAPANGSTSCAAAFGPN
ncbi:MAG: peptidase domain-containing ABC transporter [Pirellulaceae bacterium]|nr:peptidase domain-containing ABC transporter [Pirellulaceae bacterium]